MSNFLIHFNKNHDRLGRFASNPGGSYGSKRAKNMSDAELGKINSRQKIERKYKAYLKSDIIERKNISDNARNSANEASNLARTLANSKRAKDLSAANKARSMSDAELRQAINRMDMERRYVSLKQSEISTGYDKAASILSASGSVLAIAGGALGVAASIKYLRG